MGLSEQIRGMAVGDTIVQAFRRPLADYRQDDFTTFGKVVSATVSRLKHSTAYDFVTETLPATVVFSGDHVLRCIAITRLA